VFCFFWLTVYFLFTFKLHQIEKDTTECQLFYTCCHLPIICKKQHKKMIKWIYQPASYESSLLDYFVKTTVQTASQASVQWGICQCCVWIRLTSWKPRRWSWSGRWMSWRRNVSRLRKEHKNNVRSRKRNMPRKSSFSRGPTNSSRYTHSAIVTMSVLQQLTVTVNTSRLW